MDEKSSSVKDQIIESLGRPFLEALDAEGITPRFLSKKLRRELGAKENKVFMPNDKQATVILKALVAVLSRIDPAPADATDEQKEKRREEMRGAVERMLPNLLIYSKGMVAWDVRQKARQDAHKLRGDYPPEEKRVAGPGGGPIPMKFYDFDPSKFPKGE